MKRFITILFLVDIALILLFPNLGGTTGRAYYTYITYILIPLTFIWDRKNHITVNNPIIWDYIKVTIIFCILITLGACLSFLFGDSKVVFDFQTYFSNIILIFYAYIFLILSIDKKNREVVQTVLITCSVILVIYSFYSYITETNIYADLLGFVQSDTAYQDYTYNRGIKFRVSGNTMNPVFFSGELMLLTGYCCHIYLKKQTNIKQWLLLGLIIALLISTFFTGSKSGIIPTFFIVVYTAYRKVGGKKLLLLLMFFLLFSSAIIPFLSAIFNINLYTLFESLNILNSDVGGSSLSMRQQQFNGLLSCVGSNVIFGNGIGWTEMFLEKYKIHPVLLGFESILFSGFCNGGLFAICVIYPVYLWKWYHVKIPVKSFPMYKIILLSYYFFILATGNGSIKYVYLLVGVILAEYIDTINTKKTSNNEH